MENVMRTIASIKLLMSAPGQVEYAEVWNLKYGNGSTEPEGWKYEECRLPVCSDTRLCLVAKG